LIYSQVFAPEALRIFAGGRTTGTAFNPSQPRKGDRPRMVYRPSGAERFSAAVPGGSTPANIRRPPRTKKFLPACDKTMDAHF